jgi:opacity protein-like surface antigen
LLLYYYHSFLTLYLYAFKGEKLRNKALLFLFCLAAVAVLSSVDAQAAGFGLYGTFSGGSADWEPEDELTFSKNTNHVGGGLVFDTAPDTDRMFNYQLNIGYDRFENENSNAWGNAIFDGVAVSNTFAFGALVNSITGNPARMG